MRSFYHAGDIGDVVYGLYTMMKLGGGDLFLGQRTALGEQLQPRYGIDRQITLWLTPLLKEQPYVHRIQWMERPPFVEYDLNRFRLFWLGQLPCANQQTHLQEMVCMTFGVKLQPMEAWLTAPVSRQAPIIVARSPRQHNHKFPWADVVKHYGDGLAFVGGVDEWNELCLLVGKRIRRLHTPNLLELAKVINGCDMFIGNSSAPLAIAEGLKKRIVQETSSETLEKAHTISYREGHDMWQEGYEFP